MNSEKCSSAPSKGCNSSQKVRKKYLKSKSGENMAKITRFFDAAPSNNENSSEKHRINATKVNEDLAKKKGVEVADLSEKSRIKDQNLPSAKNLIKIGSELTKIDRFSMSTDPQVKTPLHNPNSVVESCEAGRSGRAIVRLPNQDPTSQKGVKETVKFFGNLSEKGRNVDQNKCQSPILRSLNDRSNSFLIESPGKRKLQTKKTEVLKRKRVGSSD